MAAPTTRLTAAAYAAIAYGIVLVVVTIERAASGHPARPLVFAGVVGGLLQIVLGRAVLKRSRAAWSFLISLNGTLALAFILGAPAMYRWVAALGFVPLAAAVAIVVLLVTSDEEL